MSGWIYTYHQFLWSDIVIPFTPSASKFCIHVYMYVYIQCKGVFTQSHGNFCHDMKNNFCFYFTENRLKKTLVFFVL